MSGMTEEMVDAALAEWRDSTSLSPRDVMRSILSRALSAPKLGHLGMIGLLASRISATDKCVVELHLDHEAEARDLTRIVKVLSEYDSSWPPKQER